MVLDVVYKHEDGKKAEKIRMEETGRVKEDGEYF